MKTPRLSRMFRALAAAGVCWFQNQSILAAQKSAQTATWTTDIDNPECTGCVFVIKTTAIGTGSVTVSISGYDPSTNTTWLLLASAAIITNTTTTLKIGKNLTASANAVANDQVPRKIRITFTHNNANPADYVAGLNLVL